MTEIENELLEVATALKSIIDETVICKMCLQGCSFIPLECH